MKLNGKYKEMYLKTTNISGKEVACQTGDEGEEDTSPKREIEESEPSLVDTEKEP